MVLALILTLLGWASLNLIPHYKNSNLAIVFFIILFSISCFSASILVIYTSYFSVVSILFWIILLNLASLIVLASFSIDIRNKLYYIGSLI